MEQRLFSISRALAQSAVDAYNNHATFSYIGGTYVSDITRKVYNEIVIGVKCKVAVWKLATLITTAALIAYKQTLNPYFSGNFDVNKTLFNRANVAVHATLKKMMRETNYQRRLAMAMSF